MVSIKELKKKCVRNDVDQNTLKFYRFLCWYLTKLFIYLRISANATTLLSIILSIITATLFFFGNLWYILIGALLLEFRWMLDFVDGHVARYWNKSTMNGLFLDQFDHHLAGKLVFFSLSFGIFLHTKWIPILIFGFLASIFSMSIVYSSIYWAIIRKRQRIHKGASTKEKFERILKKNEYIDVGEVKGRYSILFSFAKRIHKIWTDPGYYHLLLIIIIIEIVNIYIPFTKPYLLLTFFIIVYGIVFTIVQFISFIVNFKGRSTDLQYQSLFGKDLSTKK